MMDCCRVDSFSRGALELIYGAKEIRVIEEHQETGGLGQFIALMRPHVFIHAIPDGYYSSDYGSRQWFWQKWGLTLGQLRDKIEQGRYCD